MKKPVKIGISAAIIAASLGSANGANLIDVYQAAADSDPALRAAKARMQSGLEGERQAFSAFLPSINASASYSEAQGEQTSGDQSQDIDSESDSIGATLNQSIFNWGNFSRHAQAKARSEQARATYDAAVADFVVRVAQTYFNVLSASDSLTFAISEEKASKRQLEQAEQRFEVGLTAITDVHEAQAAYDGTRARVISARNTLNDAEEALYEITGQYYSDLQPLQDELKLLPPEQEIDAWMDRAIANNPNVKGAMANVRATEKGIDTARSGRLPSLDGSIRYSDSSREGDQGAFTFSGSTQQTTIGVTLNVPIYQGGRVGSETRQARYDYEAAMQELDAQRLAIRRQIRNDYRSVVAGVSEVEAREQAMVSAQSAMQATQAGFEVGTRTIVDVLNSQKLLFQAQRDYSQARYDFVLSKLRLEATAGTIDEADIREVNALLQ
jgi:outer membrane protein